MSSAEIERLERALAREKKARLEAERILEEKSFEMHNNTRQLNELIAHTETLVTQRTLDLQEALEEANQANIAKSQFLATMSHEIRTPLNGVLGTLNLIKDTRLDDQQSRLIETAMSSSEILLTVINDVLDFSKINAGKLELECIPYNPLMLIEDTVELLASGAHEKGLELIASVDSNLPNHLIGDPVRLRQVLSNLVSNAIKFTSSGEVVLYLHSRSPHQYRFGVKDTGIGISEEQQNRLFQAFSQVDSSHTRKFGGTGLGLAISKSIVEAMGGELRVRSEAGQGSEFYFDLLLGSVQGDAPKLMATERMQNLKILIADSNQSNRMVLQQLLQDWGVVQVEQVADSEQLLQQLQQSQPPQDVVMLDQFLGGADKQAVIEQIRANSALAGVKIILMSRTRTIFDAALFDAVKIKPIRQSKLFNTLAKLAGEELGDSTATADTPASSSISFAGKKLLLVEDNKINQMVAQLTLDKLGFAIDLAETGEEALDRVQKNTYDLVLMDIQMPVMDGLQASREIRKLGGEFTRLPIIAMTAHALSGDREVSLEAGMNDHVTKPIERETLVRIIGKFLQPLAVNEAAEASETPSADSTALPQIAGINVAEGLDRIGNQWSAYERVLQHFRKIHQDDVKQIETAFAAGQSEQAAQLAHTLKGSSGNIGAQALFEQARQMEQVCKAADKHRFGEARQALEDQMLNVMQSLDGYFMSLEQAAEPQSKVQINASALSTVLQEIEHQLEDDYGEVMQKAQELEQAAVEQRFEDDLKSLNSAIQMMDIEAARRIIADVLKQTDEA